MKKFMVAAASVIFITAISTPAHAGKATLAKGDKVMVLSCNNGGCFTRFSKGKRDADIPKRLGPGGSQNFSKWLKKMRKNGWK